MLALEKVWVVSAMVKQWPANLTYRSTEIFYRELKHARVWGADGNRKWAVFLFNLSSHNHIYISKYLFSIRYG